MKNTLRRVLCILAAAVLITASSPAMSAAAEDGADETYLFVGGIEVTPENMNDILRDGGKAQYDPATGKLTFDSPVFDTGLEAVIMSNGLNLIIEGNAEIVGTLFGIDVEKGSLTFAGGTVYVSGGIAVKADSVIVNGGKLTAVNTLTSDSGAVAVYASDRVTVNGGELIVTASGSNCHGIFGGSGVNIVSGKVHVEAAGTNDNYGIRSSGTVSISGGETSITVRTSGLVTDAYGISASLTDIGGGTLKVETFNDDYNARSITGSTHISGGETTVRAEGSYSDGFHGGSFTMTGGKVDITCRSSENGNCVDTFYGALTVTGGELTATINGKESDALSSDDDIIITGGKITATANGEGGIGISCWTFGRAKVVISGGEVTATASGKGSFGIFTNQPLTISGGILNARGTSYGLYSEGNMTIDNGIERVTADGNEKAVFTDGTLSLGNELTVKEPRNGSVNSDKNTVVDGNGKVTAHALIANGYDHRITVNITENGAVTSSRTKANSGETVVLTVSPEENCRVGSVSVKDTGGSDVRLTETGSGYEFTMPDSDVTVSAAFDRYYAVTVEEGSAAFVSSDRTEAKAGETVKVTRLDSDDYVIKGVAVTDAEGTEVTVGEDDTFTMPAGAVTISAQTVKLYTVSFDLDGGTMEGESGTVEMRLEDGAVITLGEPVKDGYIFLYWEGSRYYAGDEYEVSEDHTLKAVWEKPAPAPYTGESILPLVYISLFAAASVCMAAVTARRRKENHRQ